MLFRNQIRYLFFSLPLAIAFTFPALQLPVLNLSPSHLSIVSGAAYAQSGRRQVRRVSRRTARRTTRRVERRHDYYRSLPSGCNIVIVSALQYWYCGGIYYREVLENGAKVYIIVNP